MSAPKFRNEFHRWNSTPKSEQISEGLLTLKKATNLLCSHIKSIQLKFTSKKVIGSPKWLSEKWLNEARELNLKQEHKLKSLRCYLHNHMKIKTNQIRECRILHDILNLLSMSSPYKHDASLGNWPASMSFSFCANLINYNHLRHVIFYCFNHHAMLQRWLRYLHSSCAPYCCMRNIAIASNFITGINNHLPNLKESILLWADLQKYFREESLYWNAEKSVYHSLVKFIRQYTSNLSHNSSLANPRPERIRIIGNSRKRKKNTLSNIGKEIVQGEFWSWINKSTHHDKWLLFYHLLDFSIA